MDLAITAIFRNEAPYLKEWIEFHYKAGFEHFYLFDNLSTDHPRNILEPYLSQGLATLISWPIDSNDAYDWTMVQCLAYERAIQWACGKTKWLAILDVDEFLFSVRDPIQKVLTSFENEGGVAVNWQVFGTSNIQKIPEDKGMIEVLNLRAPTTQVTNHYIKSIVRPERVKACENAHSMTYHPGFFQVDTRGVRFEGCLSPTVETDPLRINHYTLRDEWYLLNQKLPRLRKWWPETDLQTKYAELNQVEDTTIHSFISE
jgi:hypothetical protein